MLYAFTRFAKCCQDIFIIFRLAFLVHTANCYNYKRAGLMLKNIDDF